MFLSYFKNFARCKLLFKIIYNLKFVLKVYFEKRRLPKIISNCRFQFEVVCALF